TRGRTRAGMASEAVHHGHAGPGRSVGSAVGRWMMTAPLGQVTSRMAERGSIAWGIPGCLAKLKRLGARTARRGLVARIAPSSNSRNRHAPEPAVPCSSHHLRNLDALAVGLLAR